MNANEKGYVSGLAVDTVEDELEVTVLCLCHVYSYNTCNHTNSIACRFCYKRPLPKLLILLLQMIDVVLCLHFVDLHFCAYEPACWPCGVRNHHDYLHVCHQTEQTTSKSEFSSAIADDHTDGSTSTTKVSSVTLGVLSAHSSDLNQNVSKPQESSASDDGEGVDELVEQDALTSDAAADEQEEAPEVEPRAATKSEHRKSKDFHQYENVHLSTGTQELHVDNSTGSVEQGDALERHDDTLSLPDSIEGTTEKVCCKNCVTSLMNKALDWQIVVYMILANALYPHTHSRLHAKYLCLPLTKNFLTWSYSYRTSKIRLLSYATNYLTTLFKGVRVNVF